MGIKKSLAGLLAVVGATSVLAQRGPASPVIVVLEQNARFEDFAGQYAPDDRSAADPAAWGYLNRGVAGAVQMLERRGGFRADNVYSHSVRGFSARLTTAQIQQLQNDSLVRYVEPDGEMTANAQTTPWGIGRVNATISSTLAGNGSGTVNVVNVYVIDTGIYSHSDLTVVQHVNFAGGANRDCNGHGTHVAGTIAAKDNTSDVVGVAPGARLRGVKVLGCSGSGTTSGVVKGIDWVTANAIKPAVANMSLGGGASQALDDAVKRSVDSGVLYAVAAGNSAANACNSSPARAGTYAGVVTVAATDSANQEASFSNFGTCVDVWAPGVNILSTRLNGGTTTLSGTSMASPHVAGVGALYLSTNPLASPAAVETRLKLDADLTGTTSKGGQAITLIDARTY